MLSDSVEDEDSPSEKKHANVPSSSTELEQFEPPDYESYLPPEAYAEEDSLLMSGKQLLNVPGQETARRTSRRDTDSDVKPVSQDARGRGVKSFIPRASASARHSTPRMTDEEMANRKLKAQNDRQAREILDLKQAAARHRPRADSDDLDDRVRSVRDSIGVMRSSRGRGYNRQTTVEAVNSLELLKDAMRGVGQKPELDVITAENVYPWIEACNKVQSLETEVFNDYFPVLFSCETWANIQDWNAARKEDKERPGEYWPIKLGHGVIVGRTGFTDSTKATTDRLSQYVPNYKRECDLNDVHGEGLRGVSWERVCSVLRAMVAPKKKKAFKSQLEREASRLLSKSMRNQLNAQNGPLDLIEGVLVATKCKAAMKTIADAMARIREGQRFAKSYHETGFQEIRYDGTDGYEAMIKALLESWKAAHALNLHVEMHKPYPFDSVRELREELAATEANNDKARKITTLLEYYAIYEAHWTNVYDLGHVQETTLEALGIPIETKVLQAVEAGERLYTEDDVKQLKKIWKRDNDEKLRLALAANEYHLQAVTTFNGKYGYKGNPICFREAGRMSDKDRKCDGLVKGGGVCQGHKNRNVEDWLSGLLYMIEQTKRDQVYYDKRLDHLRSLRKRIQKEGIAAIPKFEPYPGRDRPLQKMGYVSDHDGDESGDEEEDGCMGGVVNELDSNSDSDSM